MRLTVTSVSSGVCGAGSASSPPSPSSSSLSHTLSVRTLFKLSALSPPTPCVCRLSECGSAVEVTAEGGGQRYESPLPCRADALLPLPTGLLVHRAANPDDDGHRDRDRDQDRVPMLFTLMHPLEEMHPVCFPPTTLGMDDELPVYFDDPLESVVACLPDARLIVTFHQASLCHKVWHMSPAPPPPELTPEMAALRVAMPLHPTLYLDCVWTDRAHAVGSLPATAAYVVDQSPSEPSCHVCLSPAASTATVHVLAVTYEPADEGTVVDVDVVVKPVFAIPGTAVVPVPLPASFSPSTPHASPSPAPPPPPPLAAATSSARHPMCAIDSAGPSFSSAQSQLMLIHAPPRLQLWLGQSLVAPTCDLVLPADADADAAPTSSNVADSVVSMTAAPGDGVLAALTLSSGAVVSANVDLLPTSPLVCKCLAAVAAATPPPVALQLHVDVASVTSTFAADPPPASVTCSVDGVPTPVCTFLDSTGDGEWAALGVVLRALLGLGNAPPSLPPSGTPASAAWDALQASDFQSDLSFSVEATLKALEPPTAAAVPSPASSDDPSQSASAAAAAAASSSSPSPPSPLIQLFTPASATVTALRDVFLALHLLYEDCRLNVLLWRHLQPLQQLLTLLASTAGAPEWVDHYARDAGGEGCAHPVTPHLPPTGLPSQPLAPLASTPFPDVYHWLRCAVRHIRHPAAVPFPPAFPTRFPGLCPTTHAVVQLYTAMATGTPGSVATAHAVVQTLADLAVSLDQLQTLPFGVAMPLHHALHTARLHPSQDWSSDVYALVGRQDLAKLRPRPVVEDGVAGADNADGGGATLSLFTSSLTSHAGFDDPDGLDTVAAQARLRFGRDDRVARVGQLLCSSKPPFLQVERPPEASDHDVVAAQQTKLLLLSRRLCGVTVGRGMLTLSSLPPAMTEPLSTPPLKLAARVPPTNAVINLDLSLLPNASQLTDWPEFHNGVASGLRMSPGTTQLQLLRSWIRQHKPDTPSHSHGGLMLAFGLQGMLRHLSMPEVYEYLKLGHDGTTIGVLLGLAASVCGTSDPAVSKTLRLHLPAVLDPAMYAELDVPHIVQCVSLVSMGLVYQASAHRLMTEFLLGEIGRRPGTEWVEDRDAYALSAGLALGMVTLGRGGSPDTGLADLKAEDRLLRYMTGGKDPDTPQPPPSDPTRSSRLLEGDDMNVAVTAAAAAVALGLMYIRTNNAAIGHLLSPPDTLFLLDAVRPDVLLLRVVSKSLVLWDSVEPTRAWLTHQVPPIVQSIFRRLHRRAVRANPSFQGLVAGIALDFGGKEEKTREGEEGAEESKSRAMDEGGDGGGGGGGVDDSNADGDDDDDDDDDDDGVDYGSIKDAHAMCLAGGCLALGLRFAGTADPRARGVLLSQLVAFRSYRNASGGVKVSPAAANAQAKSAQHMSPAVAAACSPSQSAVSMAISATAIAVSMVMAGTGEATTFAVLHDLWQRFDRTVSFGAHMSIGMALGFLFLGGGRLTLKRTNGAVAALLAAVYPRFPAGAADNTCHPQALRHLFALAVDPRLVEVRDVDSGDAVHAPVSVTVTAEDMTASASASAPASASATTTTFDLVAPCLLPELDQLVQVAVKGPRYWEYRLDPVLRDHHAALFVPDGHRGVVLWVKRKRGHLSYVQDPQGKCSLLAGASTSVEHLLTFAQDASILALASLFCDDSAGIGPAVSTAMLYQFVNEEKMELVPLYVSAGESVRELERGDGGALAAANLGLLMEAMPDDPFVTACVQRLERVFGGGGRHATGAFWEASRRGGSVPPELYSHTVCGWARWLDLPSAQALRVTRHLPVLSPSSLPAYLDAFGEVSAAVTVPMLVAVARQVD